jgi:hypothetical protein
MTKKVNNCQAYNKFKFSSQSGFKKIVKAYGEFCEIAFLLTMKPSAAKKKKSIVMKIEGLLN